MASRSGQTAPGTGVIVVCIALDGSETAFALHTTREAHGNLMGAYERWLSER